MSDQETLAVVYAAKSTEDKHGSIPDQLRDCRVMCEREGWQVVDEFSDEGFSAFSGNRGPGLERARRAAAAAARDAGTEAVLVVQHSDRLARGGGFRDGEAHHLVKVWIDLRAENVTPRSVQDDDSLRNLVLVAVMGDRNHADSARKSEATRAGVRRRVERGHFHGGVTPYGYRYARDRNDARDRGRLEIEPAQAEAVRRVYGEYIGGSGVGAIAVSLNGDGIPSPTGRRWERSQIRKVLHSPVYRGQVHLNRETFPGAHEPIIDPETWERVQRVRASRQRNGRGRLPSGSHLLVRGLLRCGSCGAAMSPRTYERRRTREVYLCSTRRRTGGSALCQQSSVDRELVDGAVLRYFGLIGVDEEETLARLRESDDRRLAEARTLRGQAERALARAEDRLARVRRDYQDGKLDHDEDRNAEEWREQRDQLTAELDAASAEAERLLGRERNAEREAATRDVEADALSALARVRAVIAGRVDAAEDVAVVRTALMEIFSAFVLRRSGDGYVVEPVIRPDAILGDPWVFPDPADFLSPDEPVRLSEALRDGVTGTLEHEGELELRRVPLSLRPDGDTTSALSAGTNALLKLGAAPLTAAADVLELYGLAAHAGAEVDLSDAAQALFAKLDAPSTMDELARAGGVEAGDAAAALTELELAGLVAEAAGVYRRTST